MAQTQPSLRGGLLTALAELLASVPDDSAGLWIVNAPPEPEPESYASPEETDRRLDEMLEEQREARLKAGPRAGTEMLLRLLEVPASAVTKARKALSKRDGDEAAEAMLLENAVAEQESQVVGEHETIRRLLDAVPRRARAQHDIYTPAGARELLAAIEELQAGHGGEAKLAAALDKAMETQWLFAAERNAPVARQPLEWFKAALRRAVSHENGFAVVFSTTLL